MIHKQNKTIIYEKWNIVNICSFETKTLYYFWKKKKRQLDASNIFKTGGDGAILTTFSIL